jgi:acyl-CoA hydrolase
MQQKHIEDSITEQIHLLKYEDINGEGRLFGGKLVSWIDEVAGTVAKRHTGTKVTTASIDNLQFKNAAYLNDLVVIIGHLTYVGHTSMEVRVDSYVEDMNGFRRPINRAFLTMVALDDNQKPTPVPYGLIIENNIQQAEWDNAKRRIELRKYRSCEAF